MSRETIRDGALVLADGSVFEGELIGADAPIATGEVVFNTVMSGYQEVITDPSYAGQIITFTTAHLGNYGVNPTDFESRGTFCRGIVIRELARRHSNHRAEATSTRCSSSHGVPGIAGIDTRRLTRIIRDTGAIPGAFGSAIEATAPRRGPARARHRRRRPRQHGDDARPRTRSTRFDRRGRPGQPRRIVAVDYGMKRNIGRHLAQLGTVEVVPASTTADDILAPPPTASSSATARATRRCATRGRGDHRAARAGARSSGSASATSCWRGPSAPTR